MRGTGETAKEVKARARRQGLKLKALLDGYALEFSDGEGANFDTFGEMVAFLDGYTLGRKP
jgi:hypothetical protein